MPWIDLTVRRGASTKEMQHMVMAKLTDALMFWEKIPETAEIIVPDTIAYRNRS